MQNKNFIILLVLCCVFLFSSAALPITWDEVRAIGERSSNQLKSAEKQVESSEWSYRRAFSTFLPQLSASAGMTESGLGSVEGTSKSYSYGLSATQYLFKGLEDIYGVQSSYANLEYSKADLRAVKASVLYDLRVAYVDLAVARENVKLLEQIYSQRKENSKLIKLRYDSGREDKGNLMSTQASEAQAFYDLNVSKRDMELAVLKLSQLLNAKTTAEVESVEPGVAEKINFDELIGNVPEYVKAEKQLEMAELSQNETISGFLPSLSLSGNYSKRGGEWPPDTENKSWSLNISYNFFPGGSNIADRAISAANLEKAREDFKKSAKDLRFGLEEAFNYLGNALEALKVASLSQSASTERERITVVKYLNGLIGYDEWSRIEDTYIQAQKSVLGAKKNALLSEAAWHKEYGGWVK
ncbi:MAG: TolC family protein [Candidatus Saganbacteria bacterium]|nr:TolC family protein [Candidatus Saganbacteria bacterium]